MAGQFGERYEVRLFPSGLNRDLGLLCCGMDMDSSLLPGQAFWVEDIKWIFSVIPVLCK